MKILRNTAKIKYEQNCTPFLMQLAARIMFCNAARLQLCAFFRLDVVSELQEVPSRIPCLSQPWLSLAPLFERVECFDRDSILKPAAHCFLVCMIPNQPRQTQAKKVSQNFPNVKPQNAQMPKHLYPAMLQTCKRIL